MSRLSRDVLARLARVVEKPLDDLPDELEQEIVRAGREPDNTIGRYLILSEAGRGSGGVVFRAWDPVLKRLAAVKRLARVSWAEEELERSEQEIVAMAALSHPNIVQIYDAGVDHGALYYAMEWLDGGSLQEELERGPLDDERITPIAAQIADALSCAHARGLLHLDVKPSNVMLTGELAKLSDFGAVRTLLPSPESRPPGPVGTEGFMAPEQARGQLSQLDARTDVFGLGRTLARMIAGRTLRQQGIAERATRPEPSERYQTAADLAHSLRTCLLDEDFSGEHDGKQVEEHKLSKRAGALGFLAALLVWFVLSQAPFGEQQKSEDVAAIEAYVTTFLETFSYHPADLESIEQLEESLAYERASTRGFPLIETFEAWRSGDREALPEIEGLSIQLASWITLHEMLGDHEVRAFKKVRALLERFPKEPVPQLLEAMLLIGDERAVTALEALDSLDTPASLHLKAVCQLAAGEAETALPQLKRASRDHAAYAADVGLAYLLLNDLKRAEAALRLAIQSHDGAFGARQHLASALLQQGRSKEALEVLEEYVHLVANSELYEWDDTPIEALTSATRISFVLLWPSARALRSDPWLAELRALPEFEERVGAFLPRD